MVNEAKPVKRLLSAFALALAFPILGFIVGLSVGRDMDARAEAAVGVPMTAVCRVNKQVQDADVAHLCARYAAASLLRVGSQWTGLAGAALLASFFSAARFAGSNRLRNARIFPLLVPVSVLLLAGLVLAWGAILVAGTYFMMGLAFQRMMGFVALGALAAGLSLMGVLFRLLRPARWLKQRIIAKALLRDSHAGIWEFVDEIALKVRAQAPKNIVAGLVPTFYITAAPVEVHPDGTRLRGETLFISTPLCRILSKHELAAIIGHELGHYRGQDTVYSLQFAPVYLGLGLALESLSTSGKGLTALARIPAVTMLSLMYGLFSTNERAISRDRELEADRVGAQAASPQAIATSLAKVAAFAPLWGGIRGTNVDRITSGRFASNLAEVFEDAVRWNLSDDQQVRIIESLASVRLPHPSDSHPPLGQRLANLGLNVTHLTVDDLHRNADPAINLIEDYDTLEQELTVAEHRLMVALGHAKPPEGAELAEPPFLPVIYALTARFLAAGGDIRHEEIGAAESLGPQLLSSFDPIALRSYCNHLHQAPNLDTVVWVLGAAYTPEQLQALFSYLKMIGDADERGSVARAALLESIGLAWKIQTDGTTADVALGT